MEKIGRRKFFEASALGLAGYTLFVKAPQCLANAPLGQKGIELEKLTAANNQKRIADEKLMKRIELPCDVLVAGGGLSGICAAISAARHGMKTVLVQDRSRLGGNSSSEIRMHPLGVPIESTGWREGGILEELKLENAAKNTELCWEMWDFLLYDKCISEKNLTLLLDTTLCGVEMDGDKIKRATARSDTTRIIYEIPAKIFVDATGDSRLAMEAGAEVMSGREGKEKFGESLGAYDKIGTRQGSSIMFTSKLCDHPVKFTPPSWAKKITPEMMELRTIKENGLGYGYWWIELGGLYDAISDNEMLRFELLSIVMGVWDYLKNSGKYPEAANRAIETISMVPGRRETYRIVGEKIFTENDIVSLNDKIDDAVAVGGWTMDDHPAAGFYATDSHPCQQIRKVTAYNIPLSSLYAKDIKNLMMAGRNISCSHVAFTSTRVMCTCAVEGQAVGTAAAICVNNGITPSELRSDKIMLTGLQQTLLRDDQTILGIKNEDPKDLARIASVSASGAVKGSSPRNVLTGCVLDRAKENKNRWVANIADKPWIRLDWSEPKEISQIQITLDGGARSLAQSQSESLVKRMKHGPQDDILRDFTVTAILPDGSEKLVAKINDNFLKLIRVNFDSLKAKAIRVDAIATNGAPTASIKEIRVYA